MSRTENEDGNADEVQHDGWDVHHVVGPVAPAGEETVKVPKNFFGPQVDAAFSWIAVRQFDHGNALGPEEKQQCDEPKPNGDAAVCSNGGHNVEVENGDDEEEHEVRTAQEAA